VIFLRQYGTMSTQPIKQQLQRFNRLDLLGQPTPLENSNACPPGSAATSTSSAMT